MKKISFLKVILVIGLLSFFLLSLLSFSPSDIKFLQYPSNSPPVNIFGKIGAFTIYILYSHVGFAIYIGMLILLCWGIYLIIDPSKLFPFWGRLVLAIVSIVAFAGFLDILLPSQALSFCNVSPGGRYGYMISSLGSKYLNYYGSAFIFFLIGVVCFVLSSGVEPAKILFESTKTLKTLLGVFTSLKKLTFSRKFSKTSKKSIEKSENKEKKEIQAEVVSTPSRLPEEIESYSPEEPASTTTSSTKEPFQEDFLPTRSDNQKLAELSNSLNMSKDYKLPPLDLLEKVEDDRLYGDKDLKEKAEILIKTLSDFKIEAEVVKINCGPTITQFEIKIASGIKVHSVINLSDNIAMALKATQVRVVAPIPGKSTIGIEIPNEKKSMVRLYPIIKNKYKLLRSLKIPIILGKDLVGNPIIGDLAKMPHLLIAGATGSGKSVCINSIIACSLLTKTPEELKFILVDPKMVELSEYKNIPHLMSPVITDMKKAAGVLEWATRKMDERYEFLSKMKVRNIDSFNSMRKEEIEKRIQEYNISVPEDFSYYLPYIVIIIDEFADLMMVSQHEVEMHVIRLAQKSRAVGIHLILATQRPSVDVITGLIKSNLPARIAFQVTSKIDSRTILDQNGAEKLLGKGDMLFLPPDSSKVIRVQGVYVSDDEIKNIVEYFEEQGYYPRFSEDILKGGGDKIGEGGGSEDEEIGDELFNKAVEIVLTHQRGSVSLLQRKLSIGYTRAARLIDIMAEKGILGEYQGSKAREVLMTLDEWLAKKKNEKA